MANVKDVQITGYMPVIDTERESGVALLKQLGHLNTPFCGLRIVYDPQMTKKVPSRYPGGVTNLVYFILVGQEAVSFSFLDRFCECVVDQQGEIINKQIIDLEA